MLSVYNGQNFQEQFEKRYIKFEGLLAHLERMLGERETEMTEVIGVATSIKKQVEATISRFTLVPCAAQELYRHKSKRVCGY